MIEPVIGRRRSSLGSGRMSLSGSGVGLERLAIIRQTTEFEHSQQELRLSDGGDIDENLGSEQFAKDEGEFHYLSPRGLAGVSRRSLGPWLRRAGWALFCYLALLGLIRLVVQSLVNVSTLDIVDFTLREPWQHSAAAVVDGTLHIPLWLPVVPVLTAPQLDVVHDGRALAALRPEAALPLGHGGRQPVTFGGRIFVWDEAAFRRLADRMLHQPALQLELSGQVSIALPLPAMLAGTPLLGALLDTVFTVRMLRLSKRVSIRGADGLHVVFNSFSFTDGPPPPGCAPGAQPPQPARLELAAGGERSGVLPLPPPPGSVAGVDCSADSRPLSVQLEVAIHNPSSFAFLPLGSVEMLIQSADLQPFARCTTVAPIGLPHGNSTIMLTGTINVGQSDANRRAFSGALEKLLAGKPTPLEPSFARVSTALYDSALGGLTVPADLPGLPGGGARIFNRVSLLLDPAANLFELAGRPIWGNSLHDAARLDVTNPFNVTLAVLGLSASVEYEGEAIASVVVPQLLPPVLLPPLWSGVVDRRFPVELDAPIAKLQALLGRLAFGSVAVSLRANITLRTGNLTNLTVAYRQENVSVALGR